MGGVQEAHWQSVCGPNQGFNPVTENWKWQCWYEIKCGATMESSLATPDTSEAWLYYCGVHTCNNQWTSFPGGQKSRPSSVQSLGAITVRLTTAVSRQLDWAELLNIKQCSSFCVDLQQKQVLGNHRLTFSIYSIIISDETSIRERLAVTDKRTNHYRLRLQAIGWCLQHHCRTVLGHFSPPFGWSLLDSPRQANLSLQVVTLPRGWASTPQTERTSCITSALFCHRWSARHH